LVESKAAGPAETAAAKIDIGDWFSRMTSRDQEIANFLAVGNTTGETARQFEVSPGRISQKRREYQRDWREFQGESAGVYGAAAG
jgi:hypothetical protein